jgi:hypothetical protein
VTSPTRRSIVFIVDVEPDGRAVLDRENGWQGSIDALEHLARLRGALESATGGQVRFNWFLRADPQIKGTWGRADFVADACPDIIRTIEANDDYRGIHVHMWRQRKDSAGWFSDFNDPSWIEECVGTATAAFTSIFGCTPEANRFGDRWMSKDAIATLRRADIRYDLTMEPDLPAVPIDIDPHATGWLPDFTGSPRVPYVPLGDDYMKASPTPHADDLWMLPLTTSRPSLRMVRRPPYIAWASRSPNIVLDYRSVWSNLRSALDKPDRTPVVFVLRSGDLTNGRFLRNFLRTTESLIRHPALPFCEFVAANEAVSRWRSTI